MNQLVTLTSKNKTIIKKSFYTAVVCLMVTLLAAQKVPEERLTTAGIEHSAIGLGATKNDFFSSSFVKSRGESNLFDNGYLSSIRMAGIDIDGNLSICAASYFFSQEDTDFHSGLIDVNTGIHIVGSEIFYNKIWKVHDYEVLQLNDLFASGELELEDIPMDILTWPAFGNPFVSQEFVSSNVAPFHDENLDGQYNPMLGDHPIVSSSKGDFVPSQFTFSVYHDQGEHGYSKSDPMNIQFFQSQYVINCDDSDLDRTVFTILRTQNHNPDEYKDVFFGLFIDQDLGCFDDDFFGFNEETNSLYTYNAGEIDNQVCPYGIDPVGDDMTAVNAVVFENDIYALSGNTNQMMVSQNIHVYNELMGRFHDGTPITFGGTGYNLASVDTLLHLFPDFPNDPSGWSQETEEASYGNYTITPSVKVGDLAPGAVNIFEFAEVVLVEDAPVGHAIFDTYIERIDNLNQAHFDFINDMSNCPRVELCIDDCVWPGDVNNDGVVGNEDFLYMAVAHNLGTPSARPPIDFDWYPHVAEDWGTNVSGVDFKHADVNGNGVISLSDADAIEFNYRLENDTYQEVNIAAFLDDTDGISVETNFEEYTVSGTFIERLVRTEIYLGDQNNMIEDQIIGLTYDISWDTTKLKGSGFVSNGISNVFDYDIELFDRIDGVPETFIADVEVSDRVNNAHFNFNQTEQNTGGLLSRLSWEVLEDATTTNADGRDTFYLDFYNVFALNAEGEQISIGLKSRPRVIVSELNIEGTSSVNQSDINDRLVISPNPASDMIYFDCQDCSEPTSIRVIGIDGQVQQDHRLLNSQSIDVSQYASGIYILQIHTKERIYSRKFVLE